MKRLVHKYDNKIQFKFIYKILKLILFYNKNAKEK